MELCEAFTDINALDTDCDNTCAKLASATILASPVITEATFVVVADAAFLARDSGESLDSDGADVDSVGCGTEELLRIKPRLISSSSTYSCNNEPPGRAPKVPRVSGGKARIIELNSSRLC